MVSKNVVKEALKMLLLFPGTCVNLDSDTLLHAKTKIETNLTSLQMRSFHNAAKNSGF